MALGKAISRAVQRPGGLLAAAALTAGIAVGAAALLDAGGDESLVALEAPGEPTRMVSLDVAIRAVSERVGFQVKVPGRVPRGYEFGSVGSVSTVLPNSVVSLSPTHASGAGASITITQTPGRFTSQGQDRPVELGIAGVEAYEVVTERAVNYTALTATSGFAISVTPKEAAPPRAEMVEMIRSLVR